MRRGRQLGGLFAFVVRLAEVKDNGIRVAGVRNDFRRVDCEARILLTVDLHV